MTYQRNDTTPLLNEGYGLAKTYPEGWGLGRTMVAWVLFLLTCIMLSCASMAPAHADTRIGLHIGSQHFGKTADQFNNTNPGVYVYHDGWTAGTYYNSERKQSAYAGYTIEGALVGPFSYGLTLGAITGYSRANVLPMVVPSVSGRLTDTLSVRLSGVPPVGRGSSAAIHLSIERRF